ncbi:MAG: TlpA family protein disulfide reductase [Sphingomonadales bacterium]
MTHFANWVRAALLLVAGITTAASGTAAGDRTTPGDLKNLAVGEIRHFNLNDTWKPVPEITFTDRDGRELALGAFRGKVVLLNVWATWCGPCRREMPALDRLQALLGGANFQVLAIASDRGGHDPAAKFLDQVGAENLDLYVDQPGKAARDLGVFGMPATILIDREGREIGRLVGPAEWDSDDAVSFLRHVISHPPDGGSPAANSVR